MLFGFACFCRRGSPNNPPLFYALGASRVEGVKVDDIDYIFVKTGSAVISSTEDIVSVLSSFGVRPVRLSADAPDILTIATCSRQQRQAFFRPIKTARMRYRSGLETQHHDSYWYWLQPPLDTLGHPLPPPVEAYDIDKTPSSRWQEYWDRCPGGEYCTQSILD